MGHAREKEKKKNRDGRGNDRFAPKFELSDSGRSGYRISTFGALANGMNFGGKNNLMCQIYFFDKFASLPLHDVFLFCFLLTNNNE